MSMSTPTPRVFPHTLEVSYEGAQEGARDILTQLRPSWTRTDIVCKPMTEGEVNVVLCCHLSSDVKRNDALMVRVYGQNAVDRDQELAGLQMAHAAGCGQPLLALFTNGIVYGYATGRPLKTWTDILDKTVQRELGRAIAMLHHVTPDDVTVVDQSGGELKVSKESLFDRLRGWINMLPETLATDEKRNELFFQRLRRPSSQLLLEVDKLEKLLSVHGDGVVWCHNDVVHGNIIYEPQTESITVLDFEYFGPSPAAFDWATFFDVFGWYEEISLVEKSGHDPSYLSPPLTDDIFDSYLRPYLEHTHLLQGQTDKIKQQELDHFRSRVKQYLLMMSFYWGVVQLAQLSLGGLKTNLIEDEPILLDRYFEKDRPALYA